MNREAMPLYEAAIRPQESSGGKALRAAYPRE